ncbi:type II toxin-antitoxin system PemK/MazF family toxin [Thermococcus sp.]|uniref:type II toxin-antitoxin system PemK/MazF family toxin n=1 Tax=Thermococcus sp. TaxID=35749 RepID=UPI002618C414|nr:type II toxin-antitoxin system PemK/MazF family toxin [Thermococcus sp.]
MFEQGEIWTAPFPYYELQNNTAYKRQFVLKDKIRPVIIVSESNFNSDKLDVIVCQVSRHKDYRILTLRPELKKRLIIISNSNLIPGTGNLRNISIIKPFKLFTLPKDLVLNGKLIGKLDQQTLQQLLNNIHSLF